ncbi:Serine/threonine protein kinase [Nonomuraea solani]|uniref:Serine/threonine protein kinase n=1 Tax=Nonomuraea solani TaxID=1144553 RepID=A0A1H6ELR6_9ACTN|nr:serine/threonine-protein kinase [Nonomuraea solani]SEG97835.1 Serine/threonine protein kinase [Nonomuraea solani]
MPSPLKPADPPRLAGYELQGRLGEGGQGVVFLGVTESGERVAVKWLKPELSSDHGTVDRFLREAGVAQRVAPFCTAQVLATGVEDERPYIVSEYIDGPSLQEVVATRGPRTGTDLHRLAIGTVTALTAIHHAGIVHRDFKPGNVIIASDGPRVIDFGIARALDATATLTASVLGTPAYMSPEQLHGRQIGTASDLFSWAATMIYAATGKSPFHSESVAAVLTRVLHHEPDASGLDQPLRQVVTACLSKDPVRRPTADQVLQTLLGAQKEEKTAPASSVARSRARLRGPLIGASIAVALTAGAAIAVPWTRLNAAPATTATPAAISKNTPVTTPAATTLSGLNAQLFELPNDPIVLTNYVVWDAKREAPKNFMRTKGSVDPFERRGGWEARVSPDGKYVATRDQELDDDNMDSVTVTERSTGDSFTVQSVKDPLSAEIIAWSPDSSRVLLDIFDTKGDKTIIHGYAVIDVAGESIKVTKLPKTQDEGFVWGFGGKGVVSPYKGEDGLRFRDENGKVVRDLPAAGKIPSFTQDIFTPSGKSFVTDCPPPEGDETTCVWDAATGARTQVVDTVCDHLLGWYDETNLFCYRAAGNDQKKFTIEVVNLKGASVRKLLSLDYGEDFDFFYNRRTT